MGKLIRNILFQNNIKFVNKLTSYKVLILLLTTFNFQLTTNLFAETTKSIFESANTFYKNKQYDLAENRYLQVIRKDKNNIHALYNLGNTYFHLNNYAQAILYYEKANKLNPNDVAIQHNIKLVNNKLFSKQEFSKEFFITKWFKNLVYKNNANNWSKFYLFFLWMGAIALTINFIKKNSYLFRVGIIACLCTFIFGWFAYKANINETQHQYAIVIEKNASIKKAPVETLTALATIPLGTKVKIIDNDKSWIKIQLPNDKTGWISKDFIKKI